MEKECSDSLRRPMQYSSWVAMFFFFSHCISIHSTEGFIPIYSHKPSHQHHYLSMTRLQSSSSSSDENINKQQEPYYDQGEVGKGSNWIEKSFPVDTEEKVNIKKVDDYNLGISGKDFQTGSLSKRMYETIISRTSLEMSDEIKQAFTLYAMDFTAKEATRAALKQNGLEMVLQEEEEDQGMWGDIEAVRLYDTNLNEPINKLYDSLEDAVVDWTPGQTFGFVARQVPAKIKELSVDELVQALDPDGSLRREAKELRGKEGSPDEEALLSIFDDSPILSLADLASVNVRRTENAPREATDDEYAFSGSDTRGYRVINRSDLLRDSINQDGTENERTLMHVMNALVSHGVLLVDLTDGGTSFKDAKSMASMWEATERFFDKVADPASPVELPGMITAKGAGSSYAKVGYAEYESGSMKFLETRRERNTGELLPSEASQLLGTDGVSAIQKSFDIIAQVGKDVTRIAIAASNVEHGAFSENDTESKRDQKIRASQAATLLSDELIDDGNFLPRSDVIDGGEGQVSMSPHRLCRYAEQKEDTKSSREVFGAHTDSSFVTVIPVAEISGLEVYDEEAEKWYRPELKARLHWEAEQTVRGKDSSQRFDDIENGKIPWHSRYLAVMPGEYLQLATRDEISSAIHRVVATKGRPPRFSAPVLLRGRPGMKFSTHRYLGGTFGNPLLEDAEGLSMEEIHEKSQPSSYQ